jgi:hypothetical protein
MHFTDCIFLTAYKERLLHCGAAGQFIKYRNVNEDWACGGCPIPGLLTNGFCVHLRPKRHVNQNESSTEWLCAHKNSRLFTPEVCRSCEHFSALSLHSALRWTKRETVDGTTCESSTG